MEWDRTQAKAEAHTGQADSRDEMQAQGRQQAHQAEQAAMPAGAKRGSYRTSLQFIIFGLVGVLNTAVDLVVYWALLQLSVYYIAANVLSYGAGMLNSYVWNKSLTFRSKKSDDEAERDRQINKGGNGSKRDGSGQKEARQNARERGTMLRFVIWNGMTLLLSSGLIALFIELAHWSELWSKLIVTAIIVVVQFIGMKKWVFRQ